MKKVKWSALVLAMMMAVGSLSACETIPGPQGEKGEKGDTGAQGEKGEAGAQGEKGDKGDTGADGLTPYIQNGTWWIGDVDTGVSANGNKGDKGDTGARGEKGDKGDTGAQGEKGDKGDTGAQGEQGIQGIQGEKGETGATGAQGEKGDKGDTGAQGEQGIQGIQGEKGETGATGAQGEKGDKGDTGAQGEQGIQGIQGEKGETGATGAQGEKGDKGAQGNVGLSAYQLYVKLHPEYTGTESEWMEDYVNGTLSRYTVTFDLNGGTAPVGFEASVEARYGMPVALTVPTREGYTFLGWYTGETPADGQFTSTDMVASDLSLIALWRINRHTVRFLDYYGDTVKIEEVDYGMAATPPALPSSFGSHFFQGWSADTSNVTENMVVDAIYMQKTYTVTYHINGNETTEVVYYGDIPVKPADPVVDGLIFNGWFADEYYTVPYTFDTAANTDIHVYAMLSEYIMISTAEELKNIAYGYYDSKYMLANDINLNGEQWTPIDYFYGVLDGNGHKIYNFTMSGDGSQLGFINTNNGTVENLKLADFTFNIATTSTTFDAGVLAGVNNGTVQNCRVLDGIASFVFYLSTNSSSNRFNSSGGGMIGKNAGHMLNNHVEIELVSSISASGRDGILALYTGSLSGINTGTIEQCSTKVTQQFSTGPTTYSNTGPLVYQMIGGAIGENSGSVTDTECQINIRAVSGEGGNSAWNSGGFVSVNNGHISNCSTSGSIIDELGYHRVSRIGGFVFNNQSVINNCWADVDINTTGAGYDFGGFVAENRETITNCYATGSIQTITAEGAASFVSHNMPGGVISKCFSSCSVNVTSSSAVTGYFVAVAEGGSSIFKCYYDADKKVMSGSYTLTPTNTDGTAASLTDFYGTALVVDTMSWPTDVWYISENALPILQWQKSDGT